MAVMQPLPRRIRARWPLPTDCDLPLRAFYALARADDTEGEHLAPCDGNRDASGITRAAQLGTCVRRRGYWPNAGRCAHA